MESGEFVVEDRQLEIGEGYFGGCGTGQGRGKRVGTGRRFVGPVLAMRGVDVPFVAQGMMAQLATGRDRIAGLRLQRLVVRRPAIQVQHPPVCLGDAPAEYGRS